jgi:hypothetical protein
MVVFFKQHNIFLDENGIMYEARQYDEFRKERVLNMHIRVTDAHIAAEEFTVKEMVELAPFRLPMNERVPAVQGKAFDLKSWYREWKKRHGIEQAPEPSHMKVEAVDEFQAVMSWSELDQAVFLYAQDESPLQKGYPIRLYVPNGSSECLNVKSVVKIWFLHDVLLNGEATFGFKNTVSLDEIKLKK